MDNSSGYAGAQDPGNVATAIPGATGGSNGNPNLFERLLPTIGGVAGGLISSPLEALDLVSGVGGTALNVAGAGAGAAAGKWLENRLTHQAGGNGVLTSGLEGTIGQGVGTGVGSILGSILPKASGILGKTGGDFLQGQAAGGTLGRADATTLNGLGISDIRNLPGIADHITGEGGALNQGVTKSLMQNGSPVSTDGLISVPRGGGYINDIVENDSRIGDTVGNKIINTANKSVQSMLGGAQGMVGNQAADPLDALAQSRILRQAAAQASKGAARGNVEQQGAADAYNSLASELENRIFNPSGASVPLTDDIKAQVIKQLGPLQQSAPKVYTQLVHQVSEAQNAQDLRSMQQLFVKGSQAANKTAQVADMGAGASPSDIVKGTSPAALLLAGHPLTALGSVATALPVADRASAAGLSKLSDMVGSKTAAKMVPLLSRATGVAAATLPGVGASPTGVTGSAIPSGTLNTGATMTPPNGTTGTNIFSALANPMAPGNANASAEGFQALLGMLAPMLLNSTVEGNANQGAQNMQKINAAGALLPGLSTEFGQAGGAQGPIGGLLSQLAAKFTGNPAGSNYSGAAQQAQQAIAQATGLPASSVQAPNVTQGPAAAQDALLNLARILQAAGAAPTSAIPAQ